MTGCEPTYAYYADEYGGRLTEGRFKALLRRGTSVVDARIAHLSLTTVPDGCLGTYRDAVCAAIEAIDSPAMTSWSAGKSGGTYADASTMTPDAVVARMLVGTDLGRAAL